MRAQLHVDPRSGARAERDFGRGSHDHASTAPARDSAALPRMHAVVSDAVPMRAQISPFPSWSNPKFGLDRNRLFDVRVFA